MTTSEMRAACFRDMVKFIENCRRDTPKDVSADEAFRIALCTLNDVGMEGFGAALATPSVASPQCPVRGDSCDAPCKDYPNCAAPVGEPGRTPQVAQEWTPVPLDKLAEEWDRLENYYTQLADAAQGAGYDKGSFQGKAIGISICAAQLRRVLAAPVGELGRTPTLSFDGISYECAECGPHQTVLCHHWQALFERAYAAIELATPPAQGAPTPRSQVQIFGGPAPKTWDDYEEGCLKTYGGGYHEEREMEIFHHGISTVFNLLRAEFPLAVQGAPVPREESATLRETLEMIANGEWVTDSSAQELAQAALAQPGAPTKEGM
jgi:hypothetical protein